MELRYHLTPEPDTAFDVDALEQRAAAIPEVLDHLGAQREFLFCGSIHAREQLSRAFQQGAAVSYQLLGVVVIHSHRIHVHQMVTEEVLQRLAAFLTPIIQEYRCRVISGSGRDLTSRYDGRWHELFAGELPPAE